MKNKFKEYIQPTDEERKAIWENGVFVLDANVLLNMCRYSKKSSDELIAIIKTHENNLWLPYQVGMEFFNNRLGVIEGIRNGFEKLLENIGNIENVLIDNLKFKDFRSDTAHNIEQLKTDFKNFRKREKTKIKKWQKEFEDNDKDAILDEIMSLYDGKVGDDYDVAKLEEIYKEGAARYKDNIPPGFADWKNKEKDGRRHVFGDLIWWKQAIDYARDNKRNLVIVTDDKKEDWWYKVSGKTISPRVELIREFDKETKGQSFLMYKTHQFMKMAKQLDGVLVSDSSIKEVEETSSLDIQHLLDIVNSSDNKSFIPISDLNGLSGYDFGMSGQTLDYRKPFIIPQNPGQRFLSGASYNNLYSHHPETATVSSELLDFLNEHPDGKTFIPKIEDVVNPYTGDAKKKKKK